MNTIKPIALLGHIHCSGLQLYEDFSIINRKFTSNLMVLLNTMSKLLKRAHITLEGICACSSRYSLTLTSKDDMIFPYSSFLALKLNLCSLLRNEVKENIEEASSARDSRLCRALQLLLIPQHAFFNIAASQKFSKVGVHVLRESDKEN